MKYQIVWEVDNEVPRSMVLWQYNYVVVVENKKVRVLFCVHWIVLEFNICSWVISNPKIRKKGMNRP